MGADQTPDPTALNDDQLDDLLDALAERAAERDDLDLPGSGASRRSVLAGLLGLSGATAGAGVASAIGESESYGSSTGVVGTDSEPLNEANVQDLHAQEAQVDSSLGVEQINNANAVINNGSTRKNVRIINVSDESGTKAGETIDLFKFPHRGANATVAGVADIFQGFVNGGSPVFSSVEFDKSSGSSWSGTTSVSSEVDLVPVNQGDALVFRVTSRQNFARIACFCRVWTDQVAPIEILVDR